MAHAVKQNVEEWKAKLDSALHEQNAVTNILEKIETKTGVKRLHIALGLIGFLAFYLMVGYGSDFLCNFIGFLYPAYCSIKAIESKEKDDDTKWLTYWVVYSTFHLLEFFTDILLFWIPFYWFLKFTFYMTKCPTLLEILKVSSNFSSWKSLISTGILCVFLIYCFAPMSWNGSLTIYNRLIRPLILKHQKKIDEAVGKAASAAKTVLDEAEDVAREASSDFVKKQFETKFD